MLKVWTVDRQRGADYCRLSQVLPSPRSFPSTPSSKAWSCDSISMLCEQRARRAVKSTVVVQTGAGNLVEAPNVCLKGACRVASAAQHVRRLTERLCRCGALGGRESVYFADHCCDFPAACVQISSRLRNNADASRGSPVVDSILSCQWSWCVRLERSAVSGGTATLVQALQAYSGLHIACMSIIEGTWKSAGG